MPIDIHPDPEIVRVDLSGKLHTRDYETLVPAIERLVAERGKVRMLVTMHDFHGWTAGAVWEDTKFAARHFRDMERIALVGEKSWQHGMAVFCKPFTTASLRYFDHTEAAAAEAWVRGG